MDSDPEKKPFLQRFKEANELRKRYPDKIPVIITRASVSDNSIPDITKKRYLVPGHFSFGQFIYIIRKQLDLPPEKALFIFIGNSLVPASWPISDIYKNYMSADGFVYMKYSGESTFGSACRRAPAS
jgi:GABA(A) receptor-associated protein